MGDECVNLKNNKRPHIILKALRKKIKINQYSYIRLKSQNSYRSQTRKKEM